MTQKARMIFSFSKEQLDEIKSEASKMGVSVNAYVQFVLGNHLSTKKALMSSTTDKLEELLEKLSKEIKEVKDE